MTPDPLDTLKYIAMLSDLLLGTVEEAETFLDDLDALVKPFGPISEESVYSDGSPVVSRFANGAAHYNLPPGLKTGGAS